MDKTLEQRVYDLEDRTRGIQHDLKTVINEVEELAKTDYKAVKALAEVVEDIRKKHNGLAKIIEALACKVFTNDDERVAELIKEAGDME